MPKLIPLLDWADMHFSPAPNIRTLRRWAKKKLIRPAPVLVGREYRVKENASYHQPKGAIHLPPVTVIHSEDPVVNDIIKNGQT
ncbi:MAG: excisionase [Candidatus Thiodiazotropha endolucinida]